MISGPRWIKQDEIRRFHNSSTKKILLLKMVAGWNPILFYFKSTGFTSSTFPNSTGLSQNQLTATTLIFTSSPGTLLSGATPAPNFNEAKMATIVGAIKPLVDDVIKCHPQICWFSSMLYDCFVCFFGNFVHGNGRDILFLCWNLQYGNISPWDPLYGKYYYDNQGFKSLTLEHHNIVFKASCSFTVGRRIIRSRF